MDKEKRQIKSKRFIIVIAGGILLVIISFVMVIFFAISTFLSFKQSKDTLSDTLINQSKQTINQASLAITKSADNLEKSLGLIGENQDIRKLLDEDKDEAIENMLKVFMDYKNTYPEVQSIFLGTADKEMYIYPQVMLPEDYDPTSRVWYINALVNKGFTWSEPYMDIGTGSAIISLSLPIYNEDEVIGVLSLDLNLNLVVEKIKHIKLGSNGYMIITDQNGIMIVHPNAVLAGQQVPIEGLRDLASKEDIGIIRYSYLDKVETAIYSKIDKLKLNLIGLTIK